MDGWVDACMDLWVDEWMKEGDHLGSLIYLHQSLCGAGME